MGQVETTFTAKDDDLAKAYDRLYKQQVKQEEQLKKLTAESQKSAQQQQDALSKQDGMLGSAVGKLTAIAAGWVTAANAASLVTKEMQHQEELQKKALERLAKIGESEPGSLVNQAAWSDDEKGRFRLALEKVSKDTGQPIERLNATAGRAISAGSGMTPEQIAEGIQAGNEIVPNAGREDEAAGAAAIGLSLAKTAKVTPRQGVAMLNEAAAQSFVRDPGTFGKNMAPALKALIDRGGEGETKNVLGLLAAMTQTIGDQEGAVTATAAGQLNAQLMKAFPKAKTLDEAIRMARGDEGKRERFLKDANFEIKARPTIEALLRDPNSEVSRGYEANKKAISDPEQAEATLRRTIESFEKTVPGAVAVGHRRIGTAKAALHTNAEDAIQAEAQSAIDEAADKVQSTMVSWVDKLGTRFEMRFRDPAKVAELNIGAQIRNLEQGGVTDAEREQIDALRVLIAEVQRFAETTRAAAEDTRKIKEAAERKAQAPALPAGKER